MVGDKSAFAMFQASRHTAMGPVSSHDHNPSPVTNNNPRVTTYHRASDRSWARTRAYARTYARTYARPESRQRAAAEDWKGSVEEGQVRR